MIRLVAAFVALCVITSAGECLAAITTYVIAIGNNAPPTTSEADEHLDLLRYADDDAAAFYSFARELGAKATLLAVLDADSQRRFRGLSSVAKAPSLLELRRTVAMLRAQLEVDRRRGDQPVLLLFFSGHGRQRASAPASLVMSDGDLTRDVLYEEVLAALPAHQVHIIVDACHAEAVVRPRDVEAQSVQLSGEDMQRYLGKTTLSRFPHVGALVATTKNAQAHEWDEYQQGVFSHEVLSGLRGAADVNGDGRIEYSELQAFLAAANRDVDDPRVHIDVVAHPPPIDLRAAIVDLADARHGARIVGRLSGRDALRVEDAHGTRVLDLRGETGFAVTLLVPLGRLYLHANDREAQLIARPDDRIELASLAFGPPSMGARGAMSASLSRGLFASPYGPSYYRGYVDRNPELISVPSVVEETPRVDLLRTRPSRGPAWGMVGVAAGMAAVTGVLGGLALKAKSDFDATSLERPASDARSRFVAFEATAYTTLAVGALATGIATWLLLRSSPAHSR